MEIGEDKQGDVLVLSPEGRLDSSSAKAFEARLMEKIDAGEKAVLIDFSKLDYISSAGLRVILMGAKKLKAANGRLALCSLNDNIREVFEISGFSAILDIQPDRQAALASLS